MTPATNRALLEIQDTHVRPHLTLLEGRVADSALVARALSGGSRGKAAEAELRAVREVIDALRDGPEKETVRLFYLEGTLSAREIAVRMGVGKSAVSMRLERFRAKVRAQLTDRLAG